MLPYPGQATNGSEGREDDARAGAVRRSRAGSPTRARSLRHLRAPVSTYLDLLVDLLLVRRLQPRLANVGKRLVRSPKTYVRDPGLLHALLGPGDKEALLGTRSSARAGRAT